MNLRIASVILAALFLAGLTIGAFASGASDRPSGLASLRGDARMGLLTSLPIYRQPQASVADALSGADAEPHWVRIELEKAGPLAPLDVITPQSLTELDQVLLIQPRRLTPDENVALDGWVRGGGKVFLVADPLLVSAPPFPIGDPRNPQVTAMVDPILARWALTLEVSEEAEGDEPRTIVIGESTIPVLLGGRFALRAPAGGAQGSCALSEDAMLAQCEIGEGRVVAMADATLFEGEANDESRAALAALLGMIRD